MLTFHADDDALGVNRIDHTVTAGQNDGSRIACSHAFHAGSDERSFRHEQRHRLTLHVRAHQRAVRVVVLKEGHERGGNRDELLGAYVNIVDFRPADENEVALTAGIHQLFSDVAMLVELDVRLRDGVAIFFPRRKVEGEGLEIDVTLLVLLELVVELQRLGLFEVIADTQTALTGVRDLNVVKHAVIFHAAVWRFDEAILVDARKARERADEADVRTFRRLNWADTAVVRRVHVADFESSALTRQTARPKGRQTPFVRDFGQRVRL